MGRNLGPLNIKDSYEGLVQISGSQLTDGSGSLIPSLDVSASYATTATSASHAVNSDTAVSASFATSASHATFAETAGGAVDVNALYTASISDANITFTKGDASTFEIEVNNVSSSISASYVAGANVDGQVASAAAADTATSASYAATASVALALEGGVSLQTVLDTGNTATEDINLTGSLDVVGTITTGESSNSNTGTNGVLLGGKNNTLSNSWGFVIGGDLNSATTGNFGGVAGGQTNTSSAKNGGVFMGASNSVSGQESVIIGGRSNTATNVRSVVLGGQNLSTTKDDEVVVPSLVANDITASFASFQSASIGYLQAITGSAKIIGDAFIILNNDTPTERYAGIVVQDSGSTQNTASLEFDGQTNDWFYEYTDDGGATVDHGVAMFGPEYNTKGSPAYPTNNVIQKGDGGHHLLDSNITDDGTSVTVSTSLTASAFSGDGSGLTGVDAFPYTGSAEIAGTLKVIGNDLADDILVVQGTDSGGGAIIIAEFDSDAGAGMNNTFRFIDSSINGALLRLEPSRGTGKIDFVGTAGEIEADGDIDIASVGGNITLDANGGNGQTDISGSVNIVLADDTKDVNIINPDEKLALIVRGGIMAGSDQDLSTDNGYNNHLFGERITADSSAQTCGALAGREVEFGGNPIEYAAFIATQDSSFDSGNKSAIIGGSSNTIDTEDSVAEENVIIGGQSHRLGAGERNAIIAGLNNTIIEGNSKVIIGGKNHTLGYDSGVAEYSGSVIVGGEGHLSKHNNTVILGGMNITSSAHNTVYVPNLTLTGSGATLTFDDGTTMTTAGGGGSAFPYTGSAEITGSLIVDGNIEMTSAGKLVGTDSNVMIGSTTTTLNTNNTQMVSIGGIGNTAGSSTSLRYSALIGGGNNQFGTNNGAMGQSVMLGGNGNIMNSADDAAIIGGGSNTNTHARSVIIGGTSLSTSKTNEVVVPSLSTNGAVAQNVEAITIVANVAEIDASTGNMFTLTLQNAQSTELQLTNQVAGQTFTVQVTQNATNAGDLTFDSQFEFEGGTAFVPSSGLGAIDILTFTCFGGGNVQCVSAKNFS